MWKKVSVFILLIIFCLSLPGLALGAGKTKVNGNLSAGASGKIPPGLLKKMDGETLQIQSSIQTKIKEKIKVKVKGNPLISDLPPVIKDGRTLLPVRAVTNGLGASVEWDAEERKITVTKGDITVVLYADEYVFYVNGKKKELDVPAQLISNRTFVPLRFLAMALNVRIHYDEDEDEVIIGDETLESFTLGGKDLLDLEGIIVANPGAAGATLRVDDFTNFTGISVEAVDEEATSVTILLNGSVVKEADYATQTIAEGDVILAIVTTAGENETITRYYKVTVVGIPSASFSFIGPYNLTETSQDIAGFAVNVKQATNIDDDLRLRYLIKVTEGNLNGKVIQYGNPVEGSFTIQNGRAYFGPSEGFTLNMLPALKGSTGITTPFTIKNGLSRGVYKFTVSLVDLDDNVLVTSGQFSFVVGP